MFRCIQGSLALNNNIEKDRLDRRGNSSKHCSTCSPKKPVFRNEMQKTSPQNRKKFSLLPYPIHSISCTASVPFQTKKKCFCFPFFIWSTIICSIIRTYMDIDYYIKSSIGNSFAIFFMFMTIHNSRPRYEKQKIFNITAPLNSNITSSIYFFFPFAHTLYQKILVMLCIYNIQNINIQYKTQTYMKEHLLYEYRVPIYMLVCIEYGTLCEYYAEYIVELHTIEQKLDIVNNINFLPDSPGTTSLIIFV